MLKSLKSKQINLKREWFKWTKKYHFIQDLLQLRVGQSIWLVVSSRDKILTWENATDLMRYSTDLSKNQTCTMLMLTIPFAQLNPSFMLLVLLLTTKFMDILRDMIARRTNGRSLLHLMCQDQVLPFAASRINIFSPLVEESTKKESLILLKFMISREMLGKKFQLQSVIRPNGFQHTWVWLSRLQTRKSWFLVVRAP